MSVPRETTTGGKADFMPRCVATWSYDFNDVEVAGNRTKMKIAEIRRPSQIAQFDILYGVKGAVP